MKSGRGRGCEKRAKSVHAARSGGREEGRVGGRESGRGLGQIRYYAVKIKEKCSNANIFRAFCHPGLNVA